jgi:hypothetical protein
VAGLPCGSLRSASPVSSPCPTIEVWCFLSPVQAITLIGDDPLGGDSLVAEITADRNSAACSHENSVSVISEDIERMVCEDCGDVIVRRSSSGSGEVTRSRFARQPEFLLKLLHEEAAPK